MMDRQKVAELPKVGKRRVEIVVALEGAVMSMAIAQRFNAGFWACTQTSLLSSLAGLGFFPLSMPSVKTLGYYQAEEC
jgi:hypothetical protein